VGFVLVSVVVRFVVFFMKLLKGENLCPICGSFVVVVCTMFSVSHFVCCTAANCIGVDGAKALAKALKTNKCLRNLDLSCKCCLLPLNPKFCELNH